MRIKGILRNLWLLSCLPAICAALSLDSLYQLAAPGQGYDKYLALDSGQIYEGGILAAPGLKTGINGFGAIIDLDNGSFRQLIARGGGTVMDIQRCVIRNGPDSLAALDYADSASGALDHLTLFDNFNGVSFWKGAALNLKNSVAANHRNYGFVTEDSSLEWLSISFNDTWANANGNYMCFFGSC
jgi:hypothetical protein